MIKIEVDQLKMELDKLQIAIRDLEPYSKEFIENTINSFEGCNSDFIDEIKKVLANMTDTKAPKLLKKVQQFHDGVLNVAAEFEKRDKNMGDQLNPNK